MCVHTHTHTHTHTHRETNQKDPPPPFHSPPEKTTTDKQTPTYNQSKPSPPSPPLLHPSKIHKTKTATKHMPVCSIKVSAKCVYANTNEVRCILWESMKQSNKQQHNNGCLTIIAHAPLWICEVKINSCHVLVSVGCLHDSGITIHVMSWQGSKCHVPPVWHFRSVLHVCGHHACTQQQTLPYFRLQPCRNLLLLTKVWNQCHAKLLACKLAKQGEWTVLKMGITWLWLIGLDTEWPCKGASRQTYPSPRNVFCLQQADRHAPAPEMFSAYSKQTDMPQPLKCLLPTASRQTYPSPRNVFCLQQADRHTPAPEMSSAYSKQTDIPQPQKCLLPTASRWTYPSPRNVFCLQQADGHTPALEMSSAYSKQMDIPQP